MSLRAPSTEDAEAKGPDEKGCWLNSEHRQCCCECEHHWPDSHHCTTSPTLREMSNNKCVCSVPKGWICVGMRTQPGCDSVHSGWPEHSIGCEMFTPIKRIA